MSSAIKGRKWFNDGIKEYILHKHWQERFHPFRVEYELPIELY